MKKTTKQWLIVHASTGTNPVAVAARDALDSDATLRAEIRRLRKANSAHVAFMSGMAKGWEVQGKPHLADSIRSHLAMVDELHALKPRKAKR